MSLIDKVDALWRRIFGADTQPSLVNAIEKLREAMAMPTTGSLPGDVDALMSATGRCGCGHVSVVFLSYRRFLRRCQRGGLAAAETRTASAQLAKSYQ